MKFSLSTLLVAALAAETAVASNWFTKAAYNKWHETELERWLSDHDIPYPTPADRKDLENLVKTNWEAAVQSPYVNWDTDRLQKYLKQQGEEVKKGSEKNKDALVKQVKSSWFETEDQASDSYHNVKDWIFDSWTDSQLKSFCDKHGIPVPQPRNRDSLLKTVRENYQSAANKLNEASSYPGNWIYDSWSDSDLKSWADENGIPVPQPSNRDKLIASTRRNARIANNRASQALSSASASADAAQQTLSDRLLESWSDSQIKEWCDKNGIKVPQGSKRNELIALARKNAAKLSGDNAASKASSAYGAATSSAGNQGKKAYDDLSQGADNLVNQAAAYFAQATDFIKVQVGLEPNYASSASRSAYSASKSASSAYKSATNRAKAEL